MSRAGAAGLAVLLTVGFAGTAHANPNEPAPVAAHLVKHCHNGHYIWISQSAFEKGHADHKPDDGTCTDLTPEAEKAAKKAAQDKAAEEAAAVAAEAAAVARAAQEKAAEDAAAAAAVVKAAQDKAAEEAAAEAAAAARAAEDAAAKKAAEEAAPEDADNQPSVPDAPPVPGRLPPHGGDAIDDHIVTLPVVGAPVIVVPGTTTPTDAVDAPDDEPGKVRVGKPIAFVDAEVLGHEAERPAGHNAGPAAADVSLPTTQLEVLPALARPLHVHNASRAQVNRPAAVVLPQTGLGDDLGTLTGIAGLMVLLGGMTLTAGRRRTSARTSTRI